MRVHIWPTEHWVDDDAWAAIKDVAADAEAEIRSHLPTLEPDLYLIVNPTKTVIPETGDGGFTLGPHPSRPSPAPNGSSISSTTKQ